MKTTLLTILSLATLLGASACDPRLESLDDQVRVITPCEPLTRHNLKLPPKTMPPAGTKAFVGKNKKGNHYGQILFGRYSHVDINFGEKPPSTATVRGASSTTKGSIYQRFQTKRKNVWFSYGTFWLLIYFLLIPGSWVIFILCAVLFSIFIEGRRRMLGWIFGWPVLIIAPVILWGGGFFAGSNYKIDNASKEPVDVYINGRSFGKLPGRHHLDVRIGGASVEVEIKQKGKTLEKLVLSPDKTLWQSIKRAYYGRGKFIYNICRHNSYGAGTTHYRKR